MLATHCCVKSSEHSYIFGRPEELASVTQDSHPSFFHSDISQQFFRAQVSLRGFPCHRRAGTLVRRRRWRGYGVPEVVLDCNTHIVPHWLLRHTQPDRRRFRAASMSQFTSPSDPGSYFPPATRLSALVRHRIGDATISTPDLIKPRLLPQPSPLSRHATLKSVAPAPANSPKVLG